MKRYSWVTLFLLLSLGALVMEFVGAWDHNRDTPTWTELIVANIPEAVTLAVASWLAGWIEPHFEKAYRNREEDMQQTIPVPATNEAAARKWAWRTAVVVFLLDVAASVAVAVAPEILSDSFSWDIQWWKGLALLAAKSAITGAVAYFVRKLVPPKFRDQRNLNPIPGADVGITG